MSKLINKTTWEALANESLPTSIATQEMRQSWQDWCEYKKQRKDPPYVAITVSKLFRRFVNWGVLRSVAAIDFSIESSYQGIYEKSGQQPPPTQPTQQPKGWF